MMEDVNSATWKTLRETLGMTAQQIADALGVNLRTAQRWEGRNDPPAFAAEWIEGIWREYGRRIDVIVEGARQQDGPVILRRYRTSAQAQAAGEALPVEMHAALVGLALEALRGEGIDATVDWR
ncbi:MAG: helix-turn-helix domain-containing protein [Propionibacterium acidifaciens]|uniref:helix-turn-helix domain-containing protein n=1 Tax=Propionibacterium acidifaciens TaxID=556499 RepID=UPI003615CE71